MRNQEKNSRTSTVIALALGILVTMLATPAPAATQSVVVKSVLVSGAIVQVTVKNVSTAPALTTVGVQAVVNDTPIWSFVPVALNAGQSATVTAGFTSNVKSVLKVGMTDTGTPF